jgi:hypothetical protein
MLLIVDIRVLRPDILADVIIDAILFHCPLSMLSHQELI